MSSVCVLSLILSSSLLSVSALLSGPNNVRLSSSNLNLVLRWDPEESSSELLYTAQYKSSVTDYRTGCDGTSEVECDFSSLDINEYGEYQGRVRLQRGEEHSAWVESNTITPDKDTSIGPPKVTLLSHGPTLEVSIEDPVFRISTLRDVYNLASYNLTYWKEGHWEETNSLGRVQQNRVFLSHLQPSSRYCVQVQVHTNRNSKPGEPSAVVCERTGSTADEAPLLVLLVVLSMAVALALVVAVLLKWKGISQSLCPKDPLLRDFKQSLLAPPTSSVYVAMRDSHPAEEICHPLSIVLLIVEHRPSSLETPGGFCSQHLYSHSGAKIPETGNDQETQEE